MIRRVLLLLAASALLTAAAPIDGARLRVIDVDTVALGSAAWAERAAHWCGRR